MLKNRPHLFKELTEALQRNPVVFLVGGENSGVEKFIEGFQSHVRDTTNGIEIDATFDLTVLKEVMTFLAQVSDPQRFEDGDRFLVDSFQKLTAILSTLAYQACNELFSQQERKGKIGEHWIPRDALDSPKQFAFFYEYQAGLVLQRFTPWRGGSAYKLSDKLQCVEHFLWVLHASVKEVHSTVTITVFLPFEKLAEELLRDRKPATTTTEDSQDYYQPALELVMTLRKARQEQFKSFQNLGVLIKAPTVRSGMDDRNLLQQAVMVVPALDSGEIREVFARAFAVDSGAGVISDEVVQQLEKATSGEPWYLSLIVDEIGNSGQLQWTAEQVSRKVTDAIKEVRAAIADAHKISEADAAGSLLKSEVLVYFEYLKRTLRSGDIARPVMQWWRNPERVTPCQVPEVAKWVEVGLGRFFPHKPPRQSTLRAFAMYPQFSIGRASELAYAMATALQSTTEIMSPAKSAES